MEDREGLLLARWEYLTPTQRRAAVAAARRMGAAAARGLWWGEGWSGGEPLRPPRAGDYAWRATQGREGLMPLRWRRAPVEELAADPRVCAFAEAWEEERRLLVGEPPLPTDPSARRERLQEAAAACRAARDAYRTALRQVAVLVSDERLPRLDPERPARALPPGHPLRLVVGRAHVALWRARDAYWLAVMLARAAGVVVSTDTGAAEAPV